MKIGIASEGSAEILIQHLSCPAKKSRFGQISYSDMGQLMNCFLPKHGQPITYLEVKSS